MSYKKRIEIANPSPYQRSDYVEVDTDVLKLPPELDESSLRLIRKNGRSEEIPFQLDYIFGINNGKRILTFFSSETPSGSHEYKDISAVFSLEETSTPFTDKIPATNLKIDHYYQAPSADGPADGYSDSWKPERAVKNVKLHNGALAFSISLVRHLPFQNSINYSGSVTNIEFDKAKLAEGHASGNGEMLSPFHVDCAEKRWGQLVKLVFFSLPWDLRWFHETNLIDMDYELVWSNVGSMRAVVTLRSQVFQLEFDGQPYSKLVELNWRLYRVIYVYPDKPYYTEELIVLTDDGIPLGFRPYYHCYVNFPENTPMNLARFEHIPDYFAVWKDFAFESFGYGFAADAHIRRLELRGKELNWRLQLSYKKKCIHYFMYSPWPVIARPEGPFHIIGHYGWYERVFKPLEKLPLQKPYYPEHK